MPSVVALLSESDRAALSQACRGGSAGGRCVARSCATLASFERELRRSPADLIIYEPGFGLVERPDLLQFVEQLGSRFIVRLPLRDRSVAELVALARAHPLLGVSIQQFQDIVQTLAARDEPDNGPAAVVLTRGIGAGSELAPTLLTGALAIGRRRTSAAAHAHVFGIRPRTLSAHHQRARLPDPRRVRTWALALWTLWRLDIRGWSCKRAALAAGFDRASSLSEALLPVLRASPTRRAQRGGFDRLVMDFKYELAKRSAETPPPQEQGALADRWALGDLRCAWKLSTKRAVVGHGTESELPPDVRSA